MTRVLQNLIIGGLEEAFDQQLLDAYKVTHILNVASECNIKERVDFCYTKIAIEDDSVNHDISVILPHCMEFIKCSHRGGGVVFIHCLEGKSRSVCVALVYMVLECGFSFEDAYKTIENKRSIIDVFPLYLQQARNFCSVHTAAENVEWRN